MMRRRRPPARWSTAALLAAAALGTGPLGPAGAAAQDTTRLAAIPVGEEGWNTRRTLELVERARERRQRPVADSALRNYRADVTGHIYFFIDREDEPEPVLLRADQVALELFWGQPDRVKQVIRGMRSEEQFPIRDFRYYLDRYTVVQNGFDDVIRVGEGRDVHSVVHPLAAAGAAMYDFRLGDSTTIRLPGEPDPIRVYEIQVRPRDFDLPAIVGSLFVERARGDLVRLAFTFTPASYLDPRNERVEIMLENALWEGRYWLPREQRLLVRREIPEIDLDVGTVIRAALRVEDYALNVDLPDGFFGGAEVVMAAGPEELAAYPFDEGLFDALDAAGLEGAEPGTLDDVDVEAITGRILRERFLRGVPRVRFFAPSGSDILRFGRSEGLVTGAGVALGVGRSQAFAYGGWAWGSRDPLARIGWRPAGPDRGARFEGEAYLNRPRDLGLRPATAGVLSSASAALLGQDYRDVLPASGAVVGRRWGESRSRTTASLALEHVRPAAQARTHAPFDDDRRYRPVPTATPTITIAAGVEREQRRRFGPASLSLRPSARAGFAWLDAGPGPDREWTGDPARGAFLRLRLDADAGWTGPSRRTGADARVTLAGHLGEAGPQHVWYLGGPATLPGHPFHTYGGTAAAVADLTAWRTVVPRLVRVRAFAAAGWAGGQRPFGHAADDAVAGGELAPWSPEHTDGLRASLGVGVALVDGVLRVDYALPTDTWDGALILSVDPSLWSFL